MNPITKKLLLWLSAVAAWAITLVYAFDPLNPEQHRLCSGLPQHASWDVSKGNKSVVWSYLGDLLNVVVPEWVQIWGALTPRTTEGKTLCTFTCDYWYKLDSSNQTCVEDSDADPCPPRYVLNRDTNKCEKDIGYSITNNIKNDVVFYKNELATKTVFDWELKAKDNITIDSWFIKTMYEHNFPENNNLEFTMYINWEIVSSLINLRDEANLDLSKNIQLTTWDIIDIKIDISWTPADSFYPDFYWYEIWFNGDNITLPFEYTVQLPHIVIKNSSTEYPESIIDGYNYAYEVGIETRSIDEADLSGTITKQELAKIISIWAQNEFSHSIDKNAQCNFTDITDADGDYVEYITKACQMWIMGGNGTAFHPYDTVTYAIFLTTLSRALWWDLYDWGNPYYVNHLAALKNLGVVNNPDPEANVLRWYAYSMIYKAMYNAPGTNEVVLQNNLTDSQTFKRNEITRKTVFNWTYTTVRNSNINWWMIIKRDATENSLWANNAVFYLYINWEEVWELKSTNNAWFSSWFDIINLTAWETVDVRVDVEIDWHETNVGTFNYWLELFYLGSSWELNNITDFVPMIVQDNAAKMDISTDIADSDVVVVGNKNLLWKFILTPSSNTTSWLSYIDTFTIDIDSWVNFNVNNLEITIGNNKIECEDKWISTVGSHWVKCDNVDYDVPVGWAIVEVRIKNPELWVYRTTISWINQFWDSYPIRRLIVNPFLVLQFDHDDGQQTYYNILGEGFYDNGLNPDHFSNVKLYSGNYFTLEEANNATPVIEVNDEIDITNPGSKIHFDNLAEAVDVNTFRYDSNWKTFIINKYMYPDYFANSLDNLTVHAIQNS